MTRHFLPFLILSACTPDGDGDGHVRDLDCNDTDATVFPGADERCNGVDDDCDGAVDEDAVDAPVTYADADGDGFGAGDGSREACIVATGQSETDGDCDDTRADVFPGAPEFCHDDAVNDCNATEAPHCPLSGEIPLRIALERRPVTRLDYSGLVLFPNGEGELPVTVVGSEAEGLVSLGPVLGGASTSLSAWTKLVGGQQAFVGDLDLDGAVELLVTLGDGGFRVLESPLPTGTLDVTTAGIGAGLAWGYSQVGVGRHSIIARRGDGTDVFDYYELPLASGAVPSASFTMDHNFSGAWLHSPGVGPDGEDAVFLGWYDEGLGHGGIDIFLVDRDTGPFVYARFEGNEGANARSAWLTDLDGDGIREPAVLFQLPRGVVSLVVYESAARGTIPYESDDQVVARTSTGDRRPGLLYDIDQDGILEWGFTDESFVRLPLDENLTPFAWLERGFTTRDIAFHDLDGDGLDEWILESHSGGPDGLSNGITVLPGNWP